MAETRITRRQALHIAGTLFTVGCSSKQNRNKASLHANTDSNLNTVSEAWRQIHDWLSSKAPKIVGNLNPPATDHEIREAERQLGYEMPEEWHDLYRGHNGMNSDSNLGSLFCGMQFLPLDRVVREHRKNSVTVENTLPVRAADSGIRQDDIYNAKWIALAHDSGDTLICIDLDPAPTGNLGQVIFTDHADDTAILLCKSIADFMSDFVRDLEAGRYFLNKEALEDGDQFLSCDEEIDVVNWSFSSRWKHLARRSK